MEKTIEELFEQYPDDIYLMRKKNGEVVMLAGCIGFSNGEGCYQTQMFEYSKSCEILSDSDFDESSAKKRQILRLRYLNPSDLLTKEQLEEASKINDLAEQAVFVKNCFKKNGYDDFGLIIAVEYCRAWIKLH